MLISGAWNSHCDAQPCDAQGQPAAGGQPQRLWSNAPKPEGDYYGFTHFVRQLNSVQLLRAAPLASDSRRRADRQALASRDNGRAASEKHRTDDMARSAQRQLKAAGGAWQPRWFARRDPGAYPLLPGELSAEQVPAFEWQGAWQGQQLGGSSAAIAEGRFGLVVCVGGGGSHGALGSEVPMFATQLLAGCRLLKASWWLALRTCAAGRDLRACPLRLQAACWAPASTPTPDGQQRERGVQQRACFQPGQQAAILGQSTGWRAQ